MTGKRFGFVIAALVALGAQAQAQTSTGSASAGSSKGSDVAPQQTPAYRSMPSKPSGPSGPSVSGSGVAETSAGTSAGELDRTMVGGSGSAGLAAMGGGAAAGSSTAEMGAGAMTDCPLGTLRKMGLCVPYGQAHKKMP